MSGIFGSTILEVAIGLFFIYFLLSIVCSSVNEVVAGIFKLRSKYLERGITNLLCDHDLAENVLTHPLIKAMGNTRLEPRLIHGLVERFSGTGKAGLPSYIPARTFALALFDSLAPAIEGPATVDRLRQAAVDLGNRAARASGNVSAAAVAERRRSIGRALVNLIDASQSPHRAAVTVDQVRRLIDNFETATTGDPQAPARLKQAVDYAVLDAIAREARSLQASPPAQQLLDLIRTGQSSVNSTRAFVEGLPENTDDQKAVKARLWQAVTRTSGVLESVRREVLLVPDSDARKAVLALLATAQGDLDAARNSVEVWFDNAMDRVSGVYKRRTQVFLLTIALLISAVLGVDTIRIATTLAQNASLRAALVNEATRVTNSGSQQPAQEITPVLNQLKALNLPIGYDDYPGSPQSLVPSASWAQWATWIVDKLFGLLATTFAIALGAPFWFDVLTKASNLRTSGPPPAKPNSTPAASEPAESGSVV